MKYQIICLGVNKILAEGKTKEETIKKLPQICSGCGGILDIKGIRWTGSIGMIECSITNKSIKSFSQQNPSEPL